MGGGTLIQVDLYHQHLTRDLDQSDTEDPGQVLCDLSTQIPNQHIRQYVVCKSGEYILKNSQLHIPF